MKKSNKKSKIIKVYGNPSRLLWQKGLADHKNHQAQDEPELRKHKLPTHNTMPQSVWHQVDGRMWNDLRVTQSDQSLQGSREMTMGIDDQVFHVVVHAPQAVFCEPRPPNQSLQEGS